MTATIDTTTVRADGTVTPYGFACGYVEQYDGETVGVRLWADGCYHVRRHWNAGSGRSGYIRSSWAVFDTLTDARRYYRREVGRIRRHDAAVAELAETMTAPGNYPDR